jgi:Transposase DDE domain
MIGSLGGVAGIAGVRRFLDGFLDGNIHKKRIESLSYATLGVITGASLAVSIIGQALAQARGLITKHATKQTSRLLGNVGIDVWSIFEFWVPHVIGKRSEIVVAMDWTDYDRDDQTTLVLSLVSRHGRATPLIWLSVWKDELTGQRNGFEDACLRRLAVVLPPGVRVIILADRGFGDRKLFAFLGDLGFDYVIRFRGDIGVISAEGEPRTAAQWVGKGGRARKLRGASVTADHQMVGAVVCVHAKGMKEPWCLATSMADAESRQIINYYAKRWTIEPSFRDTKDLRFGLGLSSIRVSDPQRRDRMLLLNAFAIVLLTVLGAAGESLGMDRHLKVNTTSRRTHSLFRQGCMLYELIPNMPEHRLRPLIERFVDMLQEIRVLTEAFSFI